MLVLIKETKFQLEFIRSTNVDCWVLCWPPWLSMILSVRRWWWLIQYPIMSPGSRILFNLTFFNIGILTVLCGVVGCTCSIKHNKTYYWPGHMTNLVLVRPRQGNGWLFRWDTITLVLHVPLLVLVSPAQINPIIFSDKSNGENGIRSKNNFTKNPPGRRWNVVIRKLTISGQIGVNVMNVLLCPRYRD